MKLAPLFAVALILTAAAAHAASIKEIFQSIADETEAGNGNGHSVYSLNGPFRETSEINKMKKEVNKGYTGHGTNDCRYDVYADIDGAIKEIKDQWNADKTANRLAGLAKKDLIQQIVYSVWDPSTGDSEYCSMSSMKVYGIDGTVLEFDFNETD